MSDRLPESSYLEYLPPILWDDDSEPFLGRFLLAFEKILTGVSDEWELRVDTGPSNGARKARIAKRGVEAPLNVQSRLYEPLEIVIDRLHHLFNPRRTNPDFLPYIANWLAFHPGAMPEDKVARLDWEARTRSRIARLANTYRANGLKRGLLRTMDVFTPSRFRPRVAVDDGESILRLRASHPYDSTKPSTLTAIAFASSWPFRNSSGTLQTCKWLLAPKASAIGTDGTDGNYLVVADAGPASNPIGADSSLSFRPGVWRVGLTGEPLDWISKDGSSFPCPTNEKDFQEGSTSARLLQPCGIAIDSGGRIYVLDQGFSPSAKPAILIGRQRSATTDGRLYDYAFLVARDSFPVGFFPMAMASDRAGKVLFVTGFDGGVAALLIVRVKNPDSAPPAVSVTRCKLANVTFAQTIAVESESDDGGFTVIIVDTRRQTLDDGVIPPDNYSESLLSELAVDLLRVKVGPQQASGTLVAESLLVAPASGRPVPPSLNPFISPTAIVVDPKDKNRLLVCDTGTKDRSESVLSPREGDAPRQDFLVKAEPAAVFEVLLATNSSHTIIRSLTPDPHLVSPTSIVMDPASGFAFITDEGVPRNARMIDLPGTTVAPRDRSDRIRLSLIFSGQRPPRNPDVMAQTQQDLESVIRSELPAQVGWNWEFNDIPDPLRPNSVPFQ